jgi:hypothetical protein
MKYGTQACVQLVHDGMFAAARDQRPIHRCGQHERDNEARQQAPPEGALGRFDQALVATASADFDVDVLRAISIASTSGNAKSSSVNTRAGPR